nr:hypothetical protein [Halorubrum litoreum]
MTRNTTQTTGDERNTQSRYRDALEAARRRRADEELTVARLVDEAYHALPDSADLDEVRKAAEDILGHSLEKRPMTDGGQSEPAIVCVGIDPDSIDPIPKQGMYAPSVHFQHDGKPTILVDKDGDGVYEIGITGDNTGDHLWTELEGGDIGDEALELLESHLDGESIDLSQDFSAAWKDDVQDERTVTDGDELSVPTAGELVHDRDGEGEDELVVVQAHHDTPAEEYPIDEVGGETVADLNAFYDAQAPVLEAVYLAEVEAVLDSWDDVDDLRKEVSSGEVSSYAFPADRLAVSGGEGQ